MGVLAGGIDPSSEQFEHLTAVGSVCFPYVAASFLAALFGGILNTVNKFAMTAASQLTLNICVIAALFIGPLYFPSTAYTMAWATFFAGFIQAFILWVNVRRAGFFVGFDFSAKKDEVKLFFKKLLFGAIGSGVLQLNILADFVLLSFLPTGAVSYFYYVDHVHQFPIGILGIAFSTALLPPLTRAIHEKNFKNAQKQMNFGLLFAFMFTLPAAVIMASLGEPIIGVIYGRGNFTPEHVRAAYPALTAFAFGLPVYMATKVFSTAFFAKKDTRTPCIGGLISIFVNILLIAVLMPYMKHTGIAWATALASWSNWVYLAVNLKKCCKVSVDKHTAKMCVKQIFISAVMLASIIMMNEYAAEHYSAGGVERNLALLTVSAASIFLFLAVGKLIRAFSFMKEIKTID
jgi:putative peptidoglycan lipid II flippase